jgi:hypothetical protein
MKKVNKDLVAFKAAMRDMREQKMHTEVLNSRSYKEYIRPTEYTGKAVNGKPLF